MGIADNVLGRLTRSNPPRVKSGGLRGRFTVLHVGAQLLPGIGVLRWTVTLAMLALVGWGIADEMRTSRLEKSLRHLLSAIAGAISAGQGNLTPVVRCGRCTECGERDADFVVSGTSR
jgi:hypothetical protein